MALVSRQGCGRTSTACLARVFCVGRRQQPSHVRCRVSCDWPCVSANGNVIGGKVLTPVRLMQARTAHFVALRNSLLVQRLALRRSSGSVLSPTARPPWWCARHRPWCAACGVRCCGKRGHSRCIHSAHGCRAAHQPRCVSVVGVTPGAYLPYYCRALVLPSRWCPHSVLT